jgi:hypothetical protein
MSYFQYKEDSLGLFAGNNEDFVVGHVCQK